MCIRDRLKPQQEITQGLYMLHLHTKHLDTCQHQWQILKDNYKEILQLTVRPKLNTVLGSCYAIASQEITPLLTTALLLMYALVAMINQVNY